MLLLLTSNQYLLNCLINDIGLSHFMLNPSSQMSRFKQHSRIQWMESTVKTWATLTSRNHASLINLHYLHENRVLMQQPTIQTNWWPEHGLLFRLWVLTIIVMTKFQKTILPQLIDQRVITFYCRYVDDTLLSIKPNTYKTLTKKCASLMIYQETSLRIL